MLRRNTKLAAIVVTLGLLSLMTAKPASATQRSTEDICGTICAPITNCNSSNTQGVCYSLTCNIYDSTCDEFGTCSGGSGRLVNCFSYAS